MADTVMSIVEVVGVGDILPADDAEVDGVRACASLRFDVSDTRALEGGRSLRG